MDEPRVVKTTEGERDLPRWFASSFAVLQGLKTGQIDIALPDGRVYRVEGLEPGPAARIDVRHPGLFARVARDGELGFCEAYVDGWWDTTDLQELLDVLLTSRGWVDRSFPGSGMVRRYHQLMHWLNRNTRSQARRNIAAHYDLGNDFYAHWLDETMTYSSAMFEDAREELAAAQLRKYASVCDRVGADDNAHLLEIGCGWGGFAEAAARQGYRVTGITLSQEQLDYARERVARAGLSDRVELRLQDYRDLRGQYDHVVSIEMFEAVGEEWWPTYFEKVRECLRPGGRAALQVITIDEKVFPRYRESADFIQLYVFPGGMLPPVPRFNAIAEAAGLNRLEQDFFGMDYALTLRRWFEEVRRSSDIIQALGYGESFLRMWRYYLAYCEVGFRTRRVDLMQAILERPA